METSRFLGRASSKARSLKSNSGVTTLEFFVASWLCNVRAAKVGWRNMLTTALLLVAVRFAEGQSPTPPILPRKYQGNGNTLQRLLNESWPVAQGSAATFTFFAPENLAVKAHLSVMGSMLVIGGFTLSYNQQQSAWINEWLRHPQKYPCLFSKTGTLAKTVATSVIQYHILPGRRLALQDLQRVAAVADYMAPTALTGHTLNVTQGSARLNGYSEIDNPDIGTKESQVIHGIKKLLVPPSFLIGCGPLAPMVPIVANKSDADLPLSMQLRRMHYADIGLLMLSTTTSFLL